MKKYYIFLLLAFIVTLHSSSQTCLPNGITFYNQSEIDDFPSDYPGCSEIEGNVNINKGWHLDSLYNLRKIGGYLRIWDNDDIVNFKGLDSLNTIDGYFDIFHCDDLHDFSGLESLVEINGYVDIVQNEDLRNFDGLSSLSTVGGNLHIRYNDKLESLSGLMNLISIDGTLMVQENDDLTTLHGIDNIDYNTMTGFAIFANNYLSECSVKSICDFLANVAYFPDIYGNDPGCNSKDEIVEQCQIISVDEYSIDNITFAPNPANNQIRILSHINEPYEVNIYTISGILKFQKRTQSKNFDISDLNEGAYIIEFKNTRNVQRQLLIKN